MAKASEDHKPSSPESKTEPTPEDSWAAYVKAHPDVIEQLKNYAGPERQRAEKAAAEWAKAHPDLVEQMKQSAEFVKQQHERGKALAAERAGWFKPPLASLRRPLPAQQEKKAPAKRRGRQAERFWQAMDALYPNGEYEVISTSDIAEAVNGRLKDEVIGTGVKKLPKKTLISTTQIGRLLGRHK